MSIKNKIVVAYTKRLLLLFCISVTLLYGCAVRGPLTLPPEDLTSIKQDNKNSK